MHFYATRVVEALAQTDELFCSLYGCVYLFALMQVGN